MPDTEASTDNARITQPALRADRASNTASTSAIHSAWRVSSPAWRGRPAPSSWETAGDTDISTPSTNNKPAAQTEEPIAIAPRSTWPSRPAITVSTKFMPKLVSWPTISGPASSRVRRIS